MSALSSNIDYDDPVAILEAKESQQSSPPIFNDYISAMSRLLAWQVEAGKPHLIGLRTLVICHTINPEIIEGMTLHQIGKQFGYGRSAIQKVSKEFSDIFKVHGIHQRSNATRNRLRAAWVKTNAS